MCHIFSCCVPLLSTFHFGKIWIIDSPLAAVFGLRVRPWLGKREDASDSLLGIGWKYIKATPLQTIAPSSCPTSSILRSKMPQGNEEAEQRLLQDQDMSYDHVLNHRLPPTDRGSAAWRFLAGVCILEGAIWGKKTFVIDMSFKTREVVRSVESP